jgi:hypothetical protein
MWARAGTGSHLPMLGVSVLQYRPDLMLRIAIFSLIAVNQMFGCVCVGFLTPKEEWRRSSLVFVGQVERASPEFSEKNPFRSQRAFVRVEEAFKGVQKGQLIEIDVTGNDCELKYSKGWRRLLYLSSQHGKAWLSPGCDRSVGADWAMDDLRFLRALPASADRTRVSGEVILSGEPIRPLADVTVTIAADNGPPITAVTDSKGVFEVYDLPRGSYAVSVRVPPGLQPNFGFVSGPRTFAHKFPLAVNLGDSQATAVFYLTSSSVK